MVVGEVLQALERAGLAERREKAASYTPSALRIIGVPVPDQRRVLMAVKRDLRGEAPSQVLAFAHELLGTGVHEARQIAHELVGGRADVLALLDGEEVEALGRGNDNWASVDCFGVYVVGPAWRLGYVTDGRVRRWARSSDRWWRRTALVATVALNVRSRGGSGDPERTLRACGWLAGDRDPMVAKALSWALRALAPVDPGGVRAFLDAHGDAVPALVRREVTVKLETGRKQRRRSAGPRTRAKRGVD